MNVSPQVPRSRNPRPTAPSYVGQQAQDTQAQRLRAPRVLIQVPDLNAPVRPTAIPTTPAPSVSFARHVTPTRSAATLGVLVVLTVGMVLMGRGKEEATPEKPGFNEKTPSLWVGTPNEGAAPGKFASDLPTASTPHASPAAGVHLQAKGGVESRPVSPFEYRSSFSSSASQAPELVGPQLNQSSQLPGTSNSYSSPLGGNNSQLNSASQYSPSSNPVPSMAASHPGAAMFARDAGAGSSAYDQKMPTANQDSMGQYSQDASGWNDASTYRTATRPDHPPSSGYQTSSGSDQYSAQPNYSAAQTIRPAQTTPPEAMPAGTRPIPARALAAAQAAIIPAATTPAAAIPASAAADTRASFPASPASPVSKAPSSSSASERAMSTIDQAFIKAYGDESHEASPGGGRPRPQTTRKPAGGAATRQAPAAMGAAVATPAPHSRFQAQPAVKHQTTAPEATMPAAMQQRAPKGAGAAVKAPLSAFAASSAATIAPPQPVAAPFRAALEVDNFVWPAICDSLDDKAADSFDGLAEEVIGAVSLGHTVVAMTGCRRGEGRSSMLLCLARHLSARGMKICVVDADFENGQLVRQLGMAVEAGFESVIAGDLPVNEVLVESLADHMALLPLQGRSSLEAVGSAPGRIAETLDILREHYDLVLVDTGPLMEGSQSGLHLICEHSGIHAAILVSDLRHSRRDQLAQAQRLLSSAGVELLGVAENFVSDAG